MGLCNGWLMQGIFSYPKIILRATLILFICMLTCQYHSAFVACSVEEGDSSLLFQNILSGMLLVSYQEVPSWVN